MPDLSREIRTDSEGRDGTYQAYEVKAETWQQEARYKSSIWRKPCIYETAYRRKVYTKLEDERLTYVLNGGTLKEKDKITTSQGESYRVVSIRPYKELYLEMEKL